LQLVRSWIQVQLRSLNSYQENMNGIWKIKKFKRGKIEKAYQFYRLFKIKKNKKKRDQIWRTNKVKDRSWIFKGFTWKSRWGEREEGRKKNMVSRTKPPWMLAHAASSDQGRRDLSNAALKDGIWWLEGPSRVVRTAQGPPTS
jgi:hypothetical protein